MTELTVQSINNQTEETTESKLAEFLQEHQEIEMILPVIMGIFITSRLGLRASNALLANLLIAGVSRQIFQQLKKAKSESTVKQPEKTPETTQIAEGYSIVHSVPGRVRLRIHRLADDPLFAKRLERLLKDDDFVLKVRVNRAAASLVIEYEAGGASEMELGLHLLSVISRAETEETIASPSSENSQNSVNS